MFDGDFASIIWIGDFVLETIVLDVIGHFGNDIIYLNTDLLFGSGYNADGNIIVIGGRGDDVLHGWPRICSWAIGRSSTSFFWLECLQCHAQGVAVCPDERANPCCL